jgi:hypothetical protein
MGQRTGGHIRVKPPPQETAQGISSSYEPDRCRYQGEDLAILKEPHREVDLIPYAASSNESKY